MLLLRRGLSTLLKKMQSEQVVPDVIQTTPPSELAVSYKGGLKVEYGNILQPSRVQEPPSLHWIADAAKFYLIAMVDPDAPSRTTPLAREWNHWLVGNVPGTDVRRGDTLVEYVGAGPPDKTGLHRYVLLVYRQDGRYRFDEAPIARVARGRANFSIRKFASKYDLHLLAGNFFKAKWDSYVPILYKEIGA